MTKSSELIAKTKDKKSGGLAVVEVHRSLENIAAN